MTAATVAFPATGAMLAAGAGLDGQVVGWPVAVASLSLIALALGLAAALGLGIGRDIVVASIRAAVQLLTVGLVFAAAFGSTRALWWAWAWVVGMVVVAAVVVGRRAPHPIPGLRLVGATVVTVAASASLAVVFGFGVIAYEPVSLVVVAGITIGNAVPTAVLGVNQSVRLCRDQAGELEALVALGLDRMQVVRFMGSRAARAAVVPQVERTKVVGLIALPGAMTGLLLAGVDPVEAVVVQLLVMYLILGTAALCVVAVVVHIVASSLTRDLRLAPWVRAAPG